MRAAMGGVFAGLGRWTSPLVLSAMLALGCSSEEQPVGVTDNSGSGGSNGTDSSHPAGTAGTSGASGIIVPPGDGGSGIADGGIGCGGPFVLMRASGDSGADACDFILTMPPPDPYNIRVYPSLQLTGAIPSGASDGWSYADPTFSEIVLLGSYCDAAMAGKITALYVLYGCSSGIP